MADKPGFVDDENIAGVHFSRVSIARHLEQPTRRGSIRTKPRHPKVSPLLLGLAPNGVYPAGSVTRSAGALLPHRFTLTRKAIRSKPNYFASFGSRRSPIRAVCFLLHLPYPHGRWTLSTIAFYGARTFLSVRNSPKRSLTQRTPGHLQNHDCIRFDTRKAVAFWCLARLPTKWSSFVS